MFHINNVVLAEDLEDVANTLRPVCKALEGHRIFLSGGTGFFGKWLLTCFQAIDAEVVVLSRDPAQFVAQFPVFERNPRFSFVQGDVRHFSFPYGSFDFVIHAATQASATLERDHPDEMYSVIVAGTRRVLEFSKQAGVKRLLYVSSGGVYGIQPPELSHIPETFPCNPVTAYGKGKLRAEQMCLDSGVETVIARCFAFVGPWLPLDTHFAIGNFIGNCIRNEPIEIKSDGASLRSYMYGSDLAHWLLAVLLRGRSGTAFNVGSDEAVSIRDLAYKVRACAELDIPITIQGTPDPRVPPPRYVPSIERAKAELGLCLHCSLVEAIRRTVAWHRTRG